MLIGCMLMWAKTANAVDLAPKNSVIFSEVFLGNPTPNAGQEFIEIYNNTAEEINLTGWRLQYTSVTKTDWNSPSRNIALSGLLAAGEYYLVSSTGYLLDVTDIAYSSSLSQSGGHLRLLDVSNELQDQIGWGNAAMPLGVSVTAPEAGSSISRLTNSLGFNLSGDNNTDFVISLTSTPKLDNIITLPILEAEEIDPLAPEELVPSLSPPVTIKYDDIQISELLPNPASPSNDSTDEFIELYNPNQYEVDLEGYVIKTGANGTYKYIIKGQTISAGGYAVFYSRDTHLVLSNTSGKVQLLAPNGSLIDQTETYTKAQDGQVFIINSGAWVWSSSESPGFDNIFTPVSVVKAAATKKASTKIAKAKTPKKNTTKKAKPPKATTPLATITSPPPTSTIHPLVIASVGSIALLYALYEYRNDLASTIYRFRRYRNARGGFWPSFATAAYDRADFRSWRWQNNLRSWFGARFRQ
jgi:Lamin Tail Domain